jgi:hypothetical protein
MDCYNGLILQIRPGSNEAPKAHYPLGEIRRVTTRKEYQMNSVAGHPDCTVWVLLHKGGRTCSEVLVRDEQFKIVWRFYVDAGAAHNIVFTNDESEYLIADSRAEGSSRLMASPLTAVSAC